MKIKVAKLIAKLLERNGITQCFSVTGGGAMHLNDGIGHAPGIRTLYMHHEQACAIAAEAYARVYNKPACLCVTTGPGGTNAITGVVGAWLDSIPMIVLSGQVRYDTTARWSGVGIRAMGDQEFDITKSIDCMTKYSEMVTDPNRIRYEVEKCIYLSQTGRPGPCWLDIPLDVQGAYVEEEKLMGFSPEAYEAEQAQRLSILEGSGGKLDADLKQKLQHRPEALTKDSPVIDEIIQRIGKAERPVFYTGNGLRIAGAHTLFLEAADLLGIPVVTGWNNQDTIPDCHPLYAGRPGNMGDRPGNFAVQNSDLIFAVGSRLSIRQVGYNYQTWAREAYVICCDVDEEELKKPSVHCDLPVHADAAVLLRALIERLKELGYKGHGSLFDQPERLKDYPYGEKDEAASCLFGGGSGLPGKTWLETCAHWKKTYPVYQDRYAAHGSDEPANVYEFIRVLSDSLSRNQITVVGNGSACVVGGHSYIIKPGTRFISNSAIASMGYDLPAAIGACVACHDVRKRAAEPQELQELLSGKDRAATDEAARQQRLNADKAYALGELETGRRDPFWKGLHEHYPPYYAHDLICVTGDGSIMMNLQELQTIVSHGMPIKLFIINNGGYHSIRQTQSNLFGDEPFVGIGEDSRDLSFPDFGRLAAAFGFPYVRAEHNTELSAAVEKTLSMEGPVICEVLVSHDQNFEPKSSAKKLPDGSLVSPPLEDLTPFLSDEEMEQNMIVKRL